VAVRIRRPHERKEGTRRARGTVREAEPAAGAARATSMPRFLRPGSVMLGGQESSSSGELHGLAESAENVFLVRRNHSRPGEQWSCQENFGHADRTSSPRRARKKMKSMLRKWMTMIQIGRR
jgi:hypothetical protein